MFLNPPATLSLAVGWALQTKWSANWLRDLSTAPVNAFQEWRVPSCEDERGWRRLYRVGQAQYNHKINNEVFFSWHISPLKVQLHTLVLLRVTTLKAPDANCQGCKLIYKIKVSYTVYPWSCHEHKNTREFSSLASHTSQPQEKRGLVTERTTSCSSGK